MSLRRSFLRSLAQVLLVAAFAVTAAITGMTHTAPTGGWVGSFANAEPTNVPAWSAELAERFPACVEQVEGILAAEVVVVESSAKVSRISTDRAFAVNTDDERANDVYVVGACQ